MVEENDPEIPMLEERISQWDKTLARMQGELDILKEGDTNLESQRAKNIKIQMTKGLEAQGRLLKDLKLEQRLKGLEEREPLPVQLDQLQQHSKTSNPFENPPDLHKLRRSILLSNIALFLVSVGVHPKNWEFLRTEWDFPGGPEVWVLTLLPLIAGYFTWRYSYYVRIEGLRFQIPPPLELSETSERVSTPPEETSGERKADAIFEFRQRAIERREKIQHRYKEQFWKYEQRRPFMGFAKTDLWFPLVVAGLAFAAYFFRLGMVIYPYIQDLQ